jgi:sugar phosphate isomerase/epimerase
VYIAASSRCFADLSFDEACRQIVDLEYDKIDIWLDEDSNHLKPSEATANPDQFAFQFRDKCRLSPASFTLAHDIEPSVMRGLCETCKAMRITQINVPAGQLGTPFNSEIDRLKEFVAIANEYGVRIGLQTKTGHLTEDPHTAVELCQSVRGLGLSLDPSYYICGPHRNQNWDQVFPYVFHMSLRDTTEKEVQVQVGLGEMDYARLIQCLKREDYSRALSVDFDPALMQDLTIRPLEMRKLRLLLETLL